MTDSGSTTKDAVLVAIDIAKARNDVLVQLPTGRRRKFTVANTHAEWAQFTDFLKSTGLPCRIAFEATGDYHRPLAYRLHQEGFGLFLVSSIAVARTRDALYNSWDKNDPKDAQVILHLLQTGTVLTWRDPLVHDYHDVQELANTYQQISLRKVRVQHSLMNHYLPLYFPEAERYTHSSRAAWFTELLLLTPCPAAVLRYSKEEFIEKARQIGGKKYDKSRWLADFYETAKTSIGLPVREDSEAMKMFRIVLEEHLDLCRLRQKIEQQAATRLATHPDYQRLQTVPGIGPVLALIILAETGDLRRFSHYRQFLKYCGFDLCTEQSGQFRGTTKLSKRGNARLRYAFWMAGAVAVRLKQNSFSKKYEDYIRCDPKNPDRKRKALTAVAAKMARVVYGVIKAGADYRRFPEEGARPGGRIPSPRAVEAVTTS